MSGHDWTTLGLICLCAILLYLGARESWLREKAESELADLRLKLLDERPRKVLWRRR